MLPILLLLTLLAQSPDPTQPPATAHLALTAEGRGVQIYRCTQQASTYTWVFQSPEATLYNPATREQTGTHSAGPTWTWNDRSSITGKVLQKSPSPDPASVPWLLLAATPAGTVTGSLTPIKLVRRSDTHGGNAPPTGCDATHANTILRVPYTATYTFYTAP
jgi:hypothetical protein